MTKKGNSTVVPMLIAILGLAACTSPRQEQPAGRLFSAYKCYSRTVAEINGHPICASDVALALKTAGHGDESVDLTDQKALERIILEEILAGNADKEGLTFADTFKAQQDVALAQVRTLERKAAANLYRAKRRAADSEVSEAEIDSYMQAHNDQYRLDYHIQQILYKHNNAALFASQLQLEKGVPFAEVARAQYGTLPTDVTPWDLGFLNWSLLPIEWQAILPSMQAGQISTPLYGEAGRSWIIYLVATRPADLTAPNLRAQISTMLKKQKIHEQEKTLNEEMLTSAKIKQF